MKSKGFTLLEVLVAVAIMAILSAIAIPNLSASIMDAHIKNYAVTMTDVFNIARSEALKTNSNVEVDIYPSQLTAELSSTGGVITVRSFNFNGLTVNATGASPVFFGPNGYTTPLGTTSQFDIGGTATCRAAGGTQRCLRVQVRSGGGVKVCDPALTPGTSAACS